jgi:cell division protein FtsL
VIGEDKISDADDLQHAAEPMKPLQMARIRRRLASSLYRLGPLPLGFLGAIIISLFALLYLNEIEAAVQARLSLQQLANQQTQLQQQNQQLREQQGILQSPAYIEAQAKHMGMIPEDPGKIHIIVISPG